MITRLLIPILAVAFLTLVGYSISLDISRKHWCEGHGMTATSMGAYSHTVCMTADRQLVNPP